MAAQAGYDEVLTALERGDYATAMGKLRPLAEAGHADAQNTLAVMYDQGQGVPEDHAEAVRWFHKAAEQGHAEAMINLGVMYHQQTDLQVILSFLFSFLGIGRWRLVKAHMWLDIAASSLPLGQRRYEVAKTRDDMAKDMTPGQIAEAKRLAREWMPVEQRPQKRRVPTVSADALWQSYIVAGTRA